MATIQDDNSTLILVHYDACDDTSDSTLKSQRGIIKDAVTDQIVCQSFGYTHEYELSDFDKWDSQLQGCIQNCHILLSEEGSLLRLFFHNDKWNLATHKRIDAFGSYWSSNKSFGELFLDALEFYFSNGLGKGKLEYESQEHLYEVFCDTLNRECVYTFLLRTNKDTRIVSRPPLQPTLYFGGYFFHGMRLAGNPTLVEWPTRVHFTSTESLRDFVATLDPLDYQGVIVLMTNQTVFKVMTPGYLQLAKIRGCEPSFQRAYLRIREDNDGIRQLLSLFPDKKEAMRNIETDIVSLATKLAQFYIRRYIHKEHIVVNKHYYYMMRLAHVWHCESRERNIVSINKFLELLDKQTPQFLGFLLSLKE
jgi:hypothetical protein